MAVYADKIEVTKKFFHLHQVPLRFIDFIFTMYDKGMMENFDK